VSNRIWKCNEAAYLRHPEHIVIILLVESKAEKNVGGAISTFTNSAEKKRERTAPGGRIEHVDPGPSIPAVHRKNEFYPRVSSLLRLQAP
jgi:hypothetical protein